MKKLLILVIGISIALMLSSCATPSERITEYDPATGKVIKLTEKYDNSTFWDGKVIGLKIEYDPNTYSPTVRLMYGRACGGRIRRGQSFKNRFTTKNMNLLAVTGGETDHEIYLESDMLKDKEQELFRDKK